MVSMMEIYGDEVCSPLSPPLPFVQLQLLQLFQKNSVSCTSKQQGNRPVYRAERLSLQEQRCF